jgi:hypothetical protein
VHVQPEEEPTNSQVFTHEADPATLVKRLRRSLRRSSVAGLQVLVAAGLVVSACGSAEVETGAGATTSAIGSNTTDRPSAAPAVDLGGGGSGQRDCGDPLDYWVFGDGAIGETTGWVVLSTLPELHGVIDAEAGGSLLDDLAEYPEVDPESLVIELTDPAVVSHHGPLDSLAATQLIARTHVQVSLSSLAAQDFDWIAFTYQSARDAGGEHVAIGHIEKTFGVLSGGRVDLRGLDDDHPLKCWVLRDLDVVADTIRVAEPDKEGVASLVEGLVRGDPGVVAALTNDWGSINYDRLLPYELWAAEHPPESRALHYSDELHPELYERLTPFVLSIAVPDAWRSLPLVVCLKTHLGWAEGCHDTRNLSGRPIAVLQFVQADDDDVEVVVGLQSDVGLPAEFVVVGRLSAELLAASTNGGVLASIAEPFRDSTSLDEIRSDVESAGSILG